MGIGNFIATKLIRGIASFAGDRRGQVALTFGLAAIPMVGAAGIAVDFARKTDAQITTQSALDGAAIAAAAAFNAGENEAAYKAAAQKFFDNNKPEGLDGTPVVNAVVDPVAGTMTVSTTASISTTLTKILGVTSMPLVSAKADDNENGNGSGNGNGNGGGDDGDAGGGDTSPKMVSVISLPSFTQEHRGEIVFVMDYSGSMNWYLGGERKYVTMRNEAAKLVNALSQAKTNAYVKFGIVPFSSEVYATMPKAYWAGYRGNGTRSSCTRDRYYPHNLSVNAPITSSRNNNTKFGQVKKTRHRVGRRWKWLPINNPNSYYWNSGWYNYRRNCSAYAGYRNLQVQPLSQNHNGTYNKLMAMHPYGYTHIAVGMEFGYHLLSPGAPFTQGVPWGTENTEKAVILLTDGQQTTEAFGNGGSYNVHNGETNLATLCTRMKNDDIRILTISYDLYDPDTENRLRNCASNNHDFYDANTRNQLSEAFSNITAKLARDMFLSK